MKKASRDRMPRSRINSTKKSRKQPSRRELITKPADDVQHLLAPEQVKVATARGLSLNDFGFQRSVSKSVFPYSQIILAPSNTIQYLERSKWSKSLMLLDLSFNKIQTLPNENFWKTNFVNLKCLYLHNNLISEWDGILGLVDKTNIAYAATASRSPAIPPLHGQSLCELDMS